MGNERAPGLKPGQRIGDLVVVRCVGRPGEITKNAPYHYEMRCDFPLPGGPCGNIEVISQKYLVGKKHRKRCLECSGRRRAPRQAIKPKSRELDFARMAAPSLAPKPESY